MAPFYYLWPAHGGSSGTAIDPDVQTYITNNSISDQTEIDATNTFILGLKANNFYTRIDRLNLMSPTSSAAALADFFGGTAMTAVGSPTYATTGFTTNGTSSYLNSGYTPNDSGKLTTNNFSYWVYLRSGTKGTSKYAMGANNNLNGKPTYFGNDNPSYTFSPGTLLSQTYGTIGSAAGLITGIKRSLNDQNLYKNGTLIVQNTTSATSGTPIARPLYLMANNNNNVANNFMPGEICFFMAATGAFTDPEVSTMYNLIQTFQTNVIVGGRQV